MTTAALLETPALENAAPTVTTCAGCGAPITGDDLNYSSTCADDPDEAFGDCCFHAHRDRNECGCLTNAMDDGTL